MPGRLTEAELSPEELDAAAAERAVDEMFSLPARRELAELAQRALDLDAKRAGQWVATERLVVDHGGGRGEIVAAGDSIPAALVGRVDPARRRLVTKAGLRQERGELRAAARAALEQV